MPGSLVVLLEMVEPPDLMKKGLRRGAGELGCGGVVEPPDLMKKGLRQPQGPADEGCLR